MLEVQKLNDRSEEIEKHKDLIKTRKIQAPGLTSKLLVCSLGSVLGIQSKGRRKLEKKKRRLKSRERGELQRSLESRRESEKLCHSLTSECVYL